MVGVVGTEAMSMSPGRSSDVKWLMKPLGSGKCSMVSNVTIESKGSLDVKVMASPTSKAMPSC